MNRILIVLSLVLQVNMVYTQTPSVRADTSKKEIKHRYKDYFLDTDRQNYLFTIALKYQNNITSKAFTSNGLYFNLGLNLCRFFSKELVFGPFFEFKPINGFFYKQPKSQSFVSDFNTNFKPSYENSNDSATAYLLKERLNENSIRGGSFGNIGLMFSIFPNRNGGILIAIKKGSESHRLSNVYGNKYIKNGEADNLYFDFSSYSLEASFKPFAVFKNSYINFNSDEGENFLKSIAISFYYTRLNLKDASINGLKWTQIVDNPFITKYGMTDTFGLTLGCTVY